MKINQFFAYALLLLIAAGAQPAYSAYWQWSKTAANNATADPTINWSEGMAPSSINDSARTQMARSAEQRDDTSGVLVTGGTSTAYTVTSNQGMCLPPSTTPQTGQSIAVTMHTANGAAPTLQVDNCSAYAILAGGSAAGVGTLLNGTPYTFKFNGSNWVASNFYNQTNFNVPLGGLIFSVSASAPNANFLMADAHCISQSTYAGLYSAMGSPGVGTCGAGAFNLPDLRGRTVAGLDNLGGGGGGSGLSGNRLTSSAAGCGSVMTVGGTACANGSESRTLAANQIPTITSSNTNGGTVHVTGDQAVAIAGSGIPISGGAGAQIQGAGTPTATGSLNVGSLTSSSTNTGGAAFPSIQPTVGYYVYVRAL